MPKHITGVISIGRRGTFTDDQGIEHLGGTYAEVYLKDAKSTALVYMDDLAHKVNADAVDTYYKALERISTVVDMKLAVDAGLKENHE